MINTEENHGQSVESSHFSLPPIYNYGSLNLFAPNSRQVNYYVGSDATLEQIRQLQEGGQSSTSFSKEEVQEAQALLPYMNEPQLALPYLRRIKGCRSPRQFSTVVMDMYVDICHTKFNREFVFHDAEFIEVLLAFVPEALKNEPKSGFTKGNVARSVAALFNDPQVQKQLEERKMQRKQAEKQDRPAECSGKGHVSENRTITDITE